MTTVLPEKKLNEARQKRGHTDAQAWADADFVAATVAEYTTRSGDRTRILKELAVAMGIGRASASDLCGLAETYEPGIREQYADVLTIGHYREAMRCKTAHPASLLSLAVESSDEWNGQPMPVDALRSHVRELNRGEEPKKTKRELYVAYVERAYKSLGEALDYCDKPAEKKSLTSMREWLQGVTA